uniref:Uncharacterized protein n=1 Tax=Fagus sylvatica TaxID=28930 RepID=A0A2N9EWZ6_FAGSY
MEILTGAAGSIVSEIVKYTAKPIVCHIGYSFCYQKITGGLTEEKVRLEQKKQVIHNTIDPGVRNNTEVANPDVQEWLTNVDQIIEEVQTLENQIQVNKMCCKGWCPDWIWRYKLGKEATKKTTNAAKLLQEAAGWDLNQLTHRAPLPDIVTFSSNDDYEVFQSRKSISEELMEALRDDNCKRIGLHGLGGVGKTTLVMDVCKKAKDLFSDIVMTTVSQTPDITKIQDEIAECLRLNLDEEKTDRGRTMRIWLRIKQAEKKILIILDDVWKDVKLGDIGIPSGEDQEKCKILLTTRSKHVCDLMHCSKKILLKFLSEEESLALIKKNASISYDSPALNDVVKKVVGECKGLPIAIVTVGKALAGKSLDDWKEALEQLRKSRLVDIYGVDEENNAYSCLKWSYNHLKCKAKLCFLLCSLFPEDYYIDIEELTRYAMGLEEYEDVNSLDEARSQVRVAINQLQDSSLLLKGYTKQYVRMHDMVRDVALWIASKGENEFKVCTRREKNMNLESVTAISLMASNTEQLPDKLVCPRLNILLLGRNEGSRKISDTLFEGMNCLKVLRLEAKILSSQSLQFLTNLQSLYLQNCDFSDNLSSLGKLKRLETLSFCNCGIVALPNELGEIESLRMLDLTNCHKLGRIPPNVIHRLSRLEELIIGLSFKNWDVEGTRAEISNANVSELSSLPLLVMLSMRLELKHLPQGFVFPNLQRYHILMNKYSVFDKLNSKALEIKDLNASSMNAFKVLFRTVEYIRIESCEMECIVDTTGGNHIVMFSNLVKLYLENMSCLRTIFARDLPQLESLELKDLPQLKQVFGHEREGDVRNENYIVLSKLRKLSLKNLIELGSLYGGNGSLVWPSLEDLYVVNCPKMELSFFADVEANVQTLGKTLYGDDCNALSIVLMQGLLTLEELEVKNCGGLLEVFKLEGLLTREGDNKICCSQDLQVFGCNALKHLFTPILARSLQNLKSLKIKRCDEVEYLIAKEEEDQILSDNHLQPLYFPKLEIVHVKRCNKLKYLFLITMTDSLLRLSTLKVKGASQLAEVFTNEDEGDIVVQKDVMLPRIENILLRELPSLVNFCPRKYHVILPELHSLTVQKCPNMTTKFTRTPDKSVHINGEVGFSRVPVVTLWPPNKDAGETDNDDLKWDAPDMIHAINTKIWFRMMRRMRRSGFIERMRGGMMQDD